MREIVESLFAVFVWLVLPLLLWGVILVNLS